MPEILDDSTQIRREWEKRAASHLSDSRGVLYSSLPAKVNQAIGNWHAALVERQLLPDLRVGAFVLDLAAGYGRLSRGIREVRSDIILFGVDFSLTYSHLYAQNIGNSVCADLRHLPFSDNVFDRIIAVTGLMYIEPDECELIVQQIIARLKPGGLALFTDPGAEIIFFLRRLHPSLAKNGTGGTGFRREEYLHLFELENCSIVAKGGNIFFTALLPILLLFRSRPRIVSSIASWAVKLDLRFGGWNRLALHRWIVVRRDI